MPSLYDRFNLVSDFSLAGVDAGTNLATKFRPMSDGVWELALTTPLANLPKGKLTVSIKDRQGNLSRIERTFSVAAAAFDGQRGLDSHGSAGSGTARPD